MITVEKKIVQLFNDYYINILERSCDTNSGVASEGPGGSISEPNNVHKFQLQASGILFFTDIQKLYGPEISQFSPWML